MIAGDSSDWDNFISSGGIASVLSLTLDAWSRIVPPLEDELEEKTSLRLYVAMVNGQNRQQHRFLIRYEDVEVDTDLEAETGRKDIAFFPGPDGSLYFCLEAKRLNARVNGKMDSNADEYVKNGMQRFVDGKYSRAVDHAGMLGYVLDGDISRAMKNVLNNIRARHRELRMKPPGDWIESPHRPGGHNVWETIHSRSHTSVRFHLQHLFVAPVSAVEKETPKRSKSGQKRIPRKPM